MTDVPGASPPRDSLSRPVPAPRAVGATLANVTIRLPGDTSFTRVLVVRPALAVLFRIAIGPAADRYVPRFLAFERAGHARPGWHWPAFLAPPVWAFYRKLWTEGVAFSLLPIAGAFAFAAVGGSLDGTGAGWWLALAFSVWLFPAFLSALAADALLWGRVRRDVMRAEGGTPSASKAVASLARDVPTSPVAAIALGGGAIVLAATLLGPPIRAEYVAHAARDAVNVTLAALRIVQEAVESAWDRTGTLAHARNVGMLLAQNDGAYVGDVAVGPGGRVRVSLGPSVPGAAGKSILLAPTVDRDQRVQWMCVPVDIPARYLPEACRR
ncbi:MAG: pilin [Betaproteobacteria bacterium]